MKPLLVAFLALSLFAVVPAPSIAAPDAAQAARLDQLFQQLKNANTENAGLALEEQIVMIWLQSGDPMIDQKMDLAIAAMDANSWDLALVYLDSIIVNKPDY